MSTPIYCNPTVRHDFFYLVDVTNGNPNGDPDAGNSPRIDPETMHGLITDVCIKRKIRDYVMLMAGETETAPLTKGRGLKYRIYIQNDGIALNAKHAEAHQALLAANGYGEGQEVDRKHKERASDRQEARRVWLCEHYYDIRTFGAVLSTGKEGDYPSGQVRGPIQLTFAESLDMIAPQDISITRCSVAEIDPKKGTTTTMGRKAFIPYGLYRGYGFFSPAFATRTGFSAEDLALFWQAIQETWDQDHSAARGLMSLQGLWIFSHDNARGRAPAHKLFERIHVRLCEDVRVPRRIEDYTIATDKEGLPTGITLTRLV